MALVGMIQVTSFATPFTWLCQGVLWIFRISFSVLSSAVLLIAEFVFLVWGICVNAVRVLLVGAYSGVLPGAVRVSEELLVSYVPMVWDYAKLFILHVFQFAYNVCVTVLVLTSSLAMHAFSFFKWFAQYGCTDAATYAWTWTVTALEWTSSAVTVAASYAIAGAVRAYSLAVQGFWAVCNGVVVGAERALPLVRSLLSYSLQASTYMFHEMYSVCASLGRLAAQVYQLGASCVVYIWSGVVPASLYIWSVTVTGFEWACWVSWTVVSNILVVVQVVFSVITEGVMSAWRVVVNIMQRTYPVIAEVFVVVLQWVGDIRFSAHMRWIAGGLWGAVCYAGSLLVMVAAQVWAVLVLVLTFVYSTVLMVFNAFLWTANVVGYSVLAGLCCIVAIIVIVVVYRKIVKYTGVTGQRVMLVVFESLNQLFASLSARMEARGARLQEHQVGEGGTQPNIQQARATQQQQDLLSSVLKGAPQTENDDRLCVICCTNEKAIMLRPCKHVCLCTECSNSIHQLNGKCPMCRKEFTEAERVYI